MSKLREFVEKVHKLTRSHEAITGIRGTNNQGALMLELYKDTAKLLDSDKSSELLLKQLNEVEARLMIAQTMRVVGEHDLAEFQQDIDEIKKEL